MNNGFFEEGKKAYNDGLTIDDNPYIFAPEEESGHMQWKKGYLSSIPLLPIDDDDDGIIPET